MGRRIHVMFACVGLLGCVRANPAFDEVLATEGSDEAESADTKDPSDTGEPGTSSSTSDTDEGSETDTSDTGPVETCEFLTRPALRLALVVPDGEQCQPSVGEMFLSVDLQTINQAPGMVTGIRCGDPTCGTCTNLSYTVGVPGFAGLAEVWSGLVAVAEPEGLDALCIEVAATALVGLQDGACVYKSLGIVDTSIEHGPVFVGNVDDAPLTWIGGVALGQAIPPSFAEQPLGSCSCVATYENVGDSECCESSGLEPEFHALSFLGVDVEPGTFEGLSIAEVPWRFHAVQAQVVANCDNVQGAPELSWALTRVE